MSKVIKKVTERKYIRYNIKFEYLDGHFRIAAIDETKYDKTKYKSMIDFYHNVLNTYKLKNVDKIRFQGIDKNNQIHVFFTKEIANEKDLDENKYTSMDNMEILKEMLDLISTLNAREVNDMKDMKSIWDKKQDILLHQMENFDLAEFNEEIKLEEKIKLFDQMQNIRKERRKLKNDIGTLTDIKHKVNLDDLKNNLNEIFKRRVGRITKARFLTDELIEELHIMKEVDYKNNKERIAYMKQLQNKYDKVVNDEPHRKLICYNRAC